MEEQVKQLQAQMLQVKSDAYDTQSELRNALKVAAERQRQTEQFVIELATELGLNVEGGIDVTEIKEKIKQLMS